MLKAAPATLPEIGAGRVDAIRRAREDLLDHAAPVPRAGLRHLHAQPVAGQTAAHEHHVALEPPDAFSSEGEPRLTLGTRGRPSDTGATSIDYRTIRHAGPPCGPDLSRIFGAVWRIWSALCLLFPAAGEEWPA